MARLHSAPTISQMAQGSAGRDHNPFGLSDSLARGIQEGTTYGTADVYRYNDIEHKLQLHDPHTTMLQVPGIDHPPITACFSGRDMRPTDLFGHAVTRNPSCPELPTVPVSDTQLTTHPAQLTRVH